VRARIWLSGCLLLLGLAIATPAAAADKRDEEAARLFYSANYQQALDLYVDLMVEKKNPAYMCNIGRCYARLGRTDEAIKNVRDCLARAKLSSSKKTEYAEILKDLQSAAPAPADASPPAPNQSTPEATRPAPPPETPPQPAAEAVAPAPPEMTSSIETIIDEKPSEIPLLAAPKKVHRPSSVGTYVLGGIGVAGLACGVGFGLAAQSAFHDVSKQYDPKRESTGRTANNVQKVGYAIGAAGIVAAGVVYLIQHASPTGPSAASVAISADGTSVGWTF
jgi:hypothetical protein